MAAQLDIDLRPEAALTDASRATQRLFARVGYTREVPDDSAASRAPLKVPAAVTIELGADGTAKFSIKDGVAESAAELHVETAQGVALISKNTTFPAEGTSSRLTFVVPVETYRDGGERTNPAEISVLARTGRFTRFDDTLPDFGRHRLYVAPMRPAQLPGGGVNPQTAAARALLRLDGSGDITDFEVALLDLAAADPAAANAMGLRDCSVRSDGTFDFSLPVTGDEIGWCWMLLGATSYVGYQADRGPAPAGSRVTIVLPLAARGETPPGGGQPPASGANPPMDFDEQQVIDNPGQFGDDPGTACFPFSNPQRILGERPFFTVLRVDQPEIGGEGSLRISRPLILELAPPLRASAIAASFNADTDAPADRRPLLADIAGRDERLARTFRMGVAAELLGQPALEARDRLEANIGKPTQSFWRRWILSRTKNRSPVTPRNPIEWEGDPTIYQAGSVAGGHILEHRVQWRSNGYSLGDVAHTLTLAPRQVRRISKICWRAPWSPNCRRRRRLRASPRRCATSTTATR